MRTRYRLVFDKRDVSDMFRNLLIQKKARVLEDETDLVVAYIFDDEEEKGVLSKLFEKEGVSASIECIFTKKEVAESEWFSIRPKFRWEYPQPEDGFLYMHETYNDSALCENCGCGLIQKEQFRVNKSPKWGTRHFLMLNWVADEIFVSDAVIDILGKAGVKGYTVNEVLNFKSNQPISNLNQICINGVLEPALIELHESVKATIRCDECGSIKYIGSGRALTFKKEMFDRLNVDIVKSAEVFGDGHMCARVILVSKKFHDLIVSNSFDRDLALEPIFLK